MDMKHVLQAAETVVFGTATIVVVASCVVDALRKTGSSAPQQKPAQDAAEHGGRPNPAAGNPGA